VTGDETSGLQRAAAVAYAASELMFLMLIQIGMLSLVLSWRVGAYAVLFGIGAHFVVRNLAVVVFAASEGDLEALASRERVFFAVSMGFQLVAWVSIFAGVAGWRFGAYVAVLGVMGLLASHLAFGAYAYRRVMTSEWPQVEPVADNDDW
jgi:hypothetical protein